MAILGKNYLDKCGSLYVHFAAFDEPFEEDVFQHLSGNYKDHIFFDMPEVLIESLCSITHRYWIFSYYDFLQFRTERCQYELLAKWLKLSAQVVDCPDFYFRSELSLYKYSSFAPDQLTENDLKRDIIETLSFVIMKITNIISEKKCLVIEGI